VALELLVVLATTRAPDWSGWNQALWDARVPASLSRSEDLRRYTGYLPARVEGRPAGFYFLTESAVDVGVQYPQLASVALADPIVWSLSYGPHPAECAAVFLSAAVLVSRFEGVAFDPQQGIMLSLEQVNEGAQQCLRLMSK